MLLAYMSSKKLGFGFIFWFANSLNVVPDFLIPHPNGSIQQARTTGILVQRFTLDFSIKTCLHFRSQEETRFYNHLESYKQFKLK